MKKRIQKYLAGEREGFSLVELIIVIAIMAILIGVVALAVIPNIQKSRESKDLTTLDNVLSAANTAVASAKIQVTSATTFDFGATSGTVACPNTDAKFQNAFNEAMSGTIAFGSTNAIKSGVHLYVILDTDKITVKLASAANAAAEVCERTDADNGSGKQKFEVTN